MTRDLTSGKPVKCIVSFVLPVLAGHLFQQVYNIIDTMIVGRVLGIDALAGVGATGAIYFLVLGFCMGLSNGFAIPIAQEFGAHDYEAMRRCVYNAFWLCGAFALAITCLTVALCRNILTLMRTPGEAFEHAYWYIVIIFAGIPFTFLYNMTAGVMRSLGDSRTPLIFVTLASLLNVALDALFIMVLKAGTAGAALATVISQAASGVMCALFLRRKFAILRCAADETRPDPKRMRELCTAGLPMGLQYSITAIGSTCLQTAVNSFGSTVAGGVAAAGKLHNILSVPYDSLGVTMAAYTGQNTGAGKLDRIDSGLKSALVLGWCYWAFILGCVLLFRRGMITLFVDPAETEAISYAEQFVTVTTGGYVLLTLVNCVRLTIQGMGFSYFAIIAGVLEMLVRTLVAFVITDWFGFSGTCFAHPSAWFAADLFLIPGFFWCRGQLRRSTVRNPNQALN